MSSAALDYRAPGFRVSLSTWSKFHFFDLARFFNERGMLGQIFTNIPRFRLAHEGIPQSLIESKSFPALLNYGLKYLQLPCPAWIERPLAWAIDDGQQHFITRRLKECDVFIALSGAGLFGGRVTQKRGGAFISERASSHVLWQRDILSEEFGRHRLAAPFFDQRMVDKELKEYAESDAVVVPSSFARHTFIEKGVDSTKVIVIPYGVDQKVFGKDVVDRNDGEFRVLWAGQISLRKGIPYLLEAFSKLKHPRKRLRMAGAVHPEMRNILRTLPLDNVEFLGVLDKAKLRRAFNDSDVFAIASIEEGLAYVIAQALAAGLPIVATENSGAADLITNGVEGFIEPARDPSALAERLRQLSDDVGLRQTMSQVALTRAAALRGWSQHGARYLRLATHLSHARNRKVPFGG